MYLLCRKKDDVVEIICGFRDIIEVDIVKNSMNEKNDSWNYDYIESDYKGG